MWPISQNFLSELPDEVNRVKIAQFAVSIREELSAKQTLLVILTLSYSDNLNTVIAIVARLLNGLKQNQDSVNSDLLLEELQHAKDLIYKISQCKLVC